MNILNSSGKIVGNTIIEQDIIVIENEAKPILIIDDVELVNKIKQKDTTAFNELFNDYTLTIGEIASLYGLCYASTRKLLMKNGLDTKSRAGRRNSSYGKTFSEERRENISKSLVGRKSPTYERTPEIRDKISKGLKKYFSEHEVSLETRQKLSDAWKRGCYKNAPMGRGYNGYFYSPLNDKDFYFRSLLELKFLLLLEESSQVECYSVEPFVIKIGDSSKYTPDVLVNNHSLIELKPSKHLNWEKKERWEQEISAATNYCNEHNLEFLIIYDTDIDFESSKFKRWLLSNQKQLQKYNIRLKKDIVWS